MFIRSLVKDGSDGQNGRGRNAMRGKNVDDTSGKKIFIISSNINNAVIMEGYVC